MDRIDFPRRTLSGAGWLLVASGLGHVVVWIVLGGGWDGPLSWRKPILFGVSAGLTSLSLAWLWSWLPPPRSRGAAAAATGAAVALFLEVALIDIQCWRGRPSHFNHATPTDVAIAAAMNLLIAWVTLFAGWLTFRFLRGVPVRDGVVMPADTVLAVRAGLLLLLWSCVLGFWAAWHGERRLAAGLGPETYGAAGVPKFAHGAVIHALQWLPLLSWIAARRGLAERARRRVVSCGVVGSVLLAAASLLQVLHGRARFDPVPATVPLFLGVAACAAAVLLGLGRVPPAK